MRIKKCASIRYLLIGPYAPPYREISVFLYRYIKKLQAGGACVETLDMSTKSKRLNFADI